MEVFQNFLTQMIIFFKEKLQEISEPGLKK